MLGWRSIIDVFYPPSCLNCGVGLAHGDLCGPCTDAISFIDAPLCSKCGVPFPTRAGGDHVCGRCLRRTPHFDRARACAAYEPNAAPDGPLAALIQRYKYNRDVSLAAALGRILTRHSPLRPAGYDVVVPVPLHTDRLRWRGFNQALLLARRFAARSRADVDPFALERIKPTRPQVDLDEQQRRSNVRSAFRVPRPESMRRRRVLLVDDVMTTGATADECARVLRSAGARSVDVLVLARALLH